jgi:hypothetical protein
MNILYCTVVNPENIEHHHYFYTSGEYGCVINPKNIDLIEDKIVRKIAKEIYRNDNRKRQFKILKRKSKT